MLPIRFALDIAAMCQNDLVVNSLCVWSEWGSKLEQEKTDLTEKEMGI